MGLGRKNRKFAKPLGRPLLQAKIKKWTLIIYNMPNVLYTSSLMFIELGNMCTHTHTPNGSQIAVHI